MMKYKRLCRANADGLWISMKPMEAWSNQALRALAGQ